MQVAFIGHREIEQCGALKDKLAKIIGNLIENESADIFLFGSRSEFNDLCLQIVTKLKEKYPEIKRVYVRGEYEYIDKKYTEYLLTMYDETYFPDSVHGAAALSYIKRNQAMVDKCDVLVAYCNMRFKPKTNTKSGTIMSVEYAKKKSRRIINLFDIT